jgi:cell division protein FtsA
MKNIEKAFAIHTRIEKIRTAKFVTMTINSSNEAIKAHDGRMNTILGLLAKGYINCAGREIDPNRNLFEEDNTLGATAPDRSPRQGHEVSPGVIRTEQEEQRAAEAAAKAKAEAVAKAEAEAAEKAAAEAAAAAEAERMRRENKWYNKLKKKLTQLGEDIVKEEN